MFTLDTRGNDVILDTIWLSKYYAVIGYQNMKVIFRGPHQPEFQFIRYCKSTGKKSQADCVTTEAKKKGVSVWDEFLDVLKEISGLPPDRALEFSINIISGTIPVSK